MVVELRKWWATSEAASGGRNQRGKYVGSKYKSVCVAAGLPPTEWCKEIVYMIPKSDVATSKVVVGEGERGLEMGSVWCEGLQQDYRLQNGAKKLST